MCVCWWVYGSKHLWGNLWAFYGLFGRLWSVTRTSMLSFVISRERCEWTTLEQWTVWHVSCARDSPSWIEVLAHIEGMHITHCLSSMLRQDRVIFTVVKLWNGGHALMRLLVQIKRVLAFRIYTHGSTIHLFIELLLLCRISRDPASAYSINSTKFSTKAVKLTKL